MRILLSLMLTTVLLTAFSGSAIGQDDMEGTEYGVFPFSTPDGMLLIINGPMLHPNAASQNDGWIGYNIYRKGPGERDFAKLNAKPISRPGSLAEMEKQLGGAVDGLEKMIGLQSKEELWRLIEQNDLSVLSLTVMSRKFRTVMGLLYWDKNVERGKKYEYQLTRVAANGTESEPSEPIDWTFGTPPFELLGPIDVTGESGDGRVTLRWKPNPDDSGAFTYSVYRKSDPDASFIRLNFSPIASMTGDNNDQINYIDTTCVNNRTYYYSVVSADYGGNESAKDSVYLFTSIDNEPPPAPPNVFAQRTETGIRIFWDASNDLNVAGYHVYRSPDPDSNFVRLNKRPLPRSDRYYHDKNVSLVDRYYYRVTSEDEAGNESRQSARTLSLYQNMNVPLPPQNVNAKGNDSGIYITWGANAETDVRGYYVYRASRYNSELTQVSPLIGVDTTYYLDTDSYLSARGRYYYVVQAVNYTGLASAYSTVAIARPLNRDPIPAPASFYGYADIGGNRLMWTPVEDNLVAGYHVYRTVEAAELSWQRLTTDPIPRNLGEYLDTNAIIGQTCIYQLRSVSSDNETGEPSHPVRVEQFEPAPLPPDNLAVTAALQGLKITWNQTFQQRVTGYRIYRRLSGQNAVVITEKDLSVNVTTYIDQNALRNHRYYYSISCIDADGREGEKSAEIEIFFD